MPDYLRYAYASVELEDDERAEGAFVAAANKMIQAQDFQSLKNICRMLVDVNPYSSRNQESAAALP